MHPIGTKVLLDGVTLSKYVTQCNVNKYLVSDFVTSMTRMCSSYFPDVLSVIQDMEADLSALPCKAMALLAYKRFLNCDSTPSVQALYHYLISGLKPQSC